MDNKINAESWVHADLIAVKDVAVCRQRSNNGTGLPSRRHSVHRGILREDVLSPMQRMSMSAPEQYPGSSPWHHSNGPCYGKISARHSRLHD